MNQQSFLALFSFCFFLTIGVGIVWEEVLAQEPSEVERTGAEKKQPSEGKSLLMRPGFRFSSKKKKSSAKGGKKEWQEGAVSLGVVTEQASLPPKLRELAQKGTMAVAAKDWKKARAIYLDLVKKAPDSALAYANLGVVEHQLKNLSAADANLTRSLTINSSIAENWLTLGLIQYEEGDLNLAISSLTRAIHEAPNDGHTRLVLAAVIRDYGWEEAAITELKRALMIDPKLAEAHYNLALTYLEMDPPKLELARRHYYTAIDLGTAVSSEIEKKLGRGRSEK